MPGPDDIFDRLKQDHDLHRDLFGRLANGGEAEVTPESLEDAKQ